MRACAGDKILVIWANDCGGHTEVTGCVANVSKVGVAIRMPRRPGTNSRVRFLAEGQKLAGEAVVRYSVPQKLDFLVGLEFIGGLAYQRQVS